MFKKNMVKFIEKYQNDKDIKLHLGGYENKPTIETKYLMALGTLENIYIVHTNGSKTHQILRNDIQSYVEYLEEQLQQKEDIINGVKSFIKKHDKRTGKLYYKYDNKYLLSEIREDLMKIIEKSDK